jgi:hypothetical protein
MFSVLHLFRSHSFFDRGREIFRFRAVEERVLLPGSFQGEIFECNAHHEFGVFEMSTANRRGLPHKIGEERQCFVKKLLFSEYAGLLNTHVNPS